MPPWIWMFSRDALMNASPTTDFATLAAGTYSYAARFSLDAGTTYTYCEVAGVDGGAGSNSGLSFETPYLPEMVVTP